MLVDIIIPLFKEESPEQLYMLQECCRGAEIQGYDVIVFYDDWTPKATLELTKKFKFKEYVLCPKWAQKSVLMKHKFMYEYSKADFVAIAQADDYLLPDKVKYQISLMDPEKDSFCNCAILVFQNKHFMYIDSFHSDPNTVFAGYNPSCWVINKKLVKEFPSEFDERWAWDQYVFLKMMTYGNVVVTHQPLLIYNLHFGNETSQMDSDFVADCQRKLKPIVKKMKFVGIKNCGKMKFQSAFDLIK